MEKQNNPSLSTVIIDIKHPLQPEWVLTTDDVHKFLKELDEKKPQMEDERDNYPPYMCSIAVDENGKKIFSEDQLSDLKFKYFYEGGFLSKAEFYKSNGKVLYKREYFKNGKRIKTEEY